jgi:hypothetical protein
MAKHMAHSNRLAEENVARVARRNAARLGVRPGDRGHTDGDWVFQYVVSNWGEGVAQDGSLTFDMDQPTLPAALRPGDAPEKRADSISWIPTRRFPAMWIRQARSILACVLRTSGMPSAIGGNSMPTRREISAQPRPSSRASSDCNPMDALPLQSLREALQPAAASPGASSGSR